MKDVSLIVSPAADLNAAKRFFRELIGSDPYADSPFVRQCAESWGSRLVNIGKAGHINAASGLGEWNEGHRLLESLIECEQRGC